jgi:23S rRNA (adenine2503-C2)-methyltransferase
MKNLLSLNLEQLEDLVTGLGERPYRTEQLLRWVHRRAEQDIDRMTDIKTSFRDQLKGSMTIRGPRLLRESTCADGTIKWLLDATLGNAIECVYIPDGGRATLCISSQVGCALECAFCATGKQGFNRNLEFGEIVGQLWFARRRVRELELQPITNVVLMGMGEPLLNYDAVLSTLRVVVHQHAYCVPRRRVTLSTSGIAPEIRRLAKDCPVALAVSLHAPTDALRDRLVPINRKYPIQQLMQACSEYLDISGQTHVTFEYVMLDGINDSDSHARELIALARTIRCKVNLIPFNPFREAGFRRSSDETIYRFNGLLNCSGVVTTTRRTRGSDEAAACGQLAGRVLDRTRRAARATARLGA